MMQGGQAGLGAQGQSTESENEPQGWQTDAAAAHPQLDILGTLKPCDVKLLSIPLYIFVIDAKFLVLYVGKGEEER